MENMPEFTYGSLDRSEKRLVLQFHRKFPFPAEKVWQALSQPDKQAAWFPTTIEGERKAGAQLRFSFTDMELPSFEGDMVTFNAPRVLEFTWAGETLRFELQNKDGGTVLTFTNIFDELGKAARDGAGWHTSLDMLYYTVSGQKALWSSADRWREVHPNYVKLFGPEASTMGPPPEWEETYGSGSKPV